MTEPAIDAFDYFKFNCIGQAFNIREKFDPVGPNCHERIGGRGPGKRNGQLLTGDDNHRPVARNRDALWPQQGIDADETCDEGVGRSLEEACRRVDLFDTAAMHHRHAIREAERLILIVGDENERRAGALVEPPELVTHLLAQALVKPGQGLVEQQDTGLHDKRAGKRHALTLTAGKKIDIAIRETGKFDKVQSPSTLVFSAEPDSPRNFSP